MFRSGPQVSAAHDREKQKQKKRLSFKDPPEVEAPKKSAGSVRTVSRSPAKESPKRRSEPAGHDLTLEDQALQIAQNVGQAFSHPEIESQNQRLNFSQTYSNFRGRINSHQAAEDQKGSSEFSSDSYPRSSALNKTFKPFTKKQDYLDALNPALHDPTMRCPATEPNSSTKQKNDIPAPTEQELEKLPTGALHQVQLLNYQLEQQGQQTQTALHQVELLKGQLDAESSARYKAQMQNHQLMVQNKELLEHIEKLFKQIEDLEKHVETLEQEKRPTKIPLIQEPQDQPRWSGAFGARRLSSDQALNDRAATTIRNPNATNRRGSLTYPSKVNSSQSKTTTSLAIPSVASRRGSLTNTLKPYATIQNRSSEVVNNKPCDSLRIGDLSPAPQQKISNPFNSGWKSKMQATTTTNTASVAKPRTNSLSMGGSKVKLPDSKQQPLFGSCTSVGSPGLVSKKCSSSTSDLYKSENHVNQPPNKPLVIEETSSPPGSANGPTGNVGMKSSSRLPHYSSFQRSKTTINDSDRVSALGRESFNFKNSPNMSLLFNK